MDGLDERLGCKFRNRDLLKQALTHPSLVAERRNAGQDNQRLEFLGDAVVQLVLTECLHQHLPGEAEGVLSQLRASSWTVRTVSLSSLEQSSGSTSQSCGLLCRGCSGEQHRNDLVKDYNTKNDTANLSQANKVAQIDVT